MLVAICDDERVDRERTGRMLALKMSGRKETLQIKYFHQGEDLIEQYENGFPGFDLIFMDIYLNHLNGMEAARDIRRYDKKVGLIFLTSSSDFAIESYDVGADGYLLKPVNQARMEAVLDRFLEEQYPRISQSLLAVNGSFGRRIPYDDIMYIESRGMKLRIVCAEGGEYPIRKKLAEVQAELTQPCFLKCNQSFIVNMDYITCADRDFTMDNGDRIPIKVRERRQIRDQYFAYIVDRGWEKLEARKVMP